MSSRWLEGAHSDGKSLVIPGRPRRHTATLRLTPLGLEVSAPAATARPFWDGYGTERGDVERVVRKYYLDVEPWPFGALVG